MVMVHNMESSWFFINLLDKHTNQWRQESEFQSMLVQLQEQLVMIHILESMWSFMNLMDKHIDQWRQQSEFQSMLVQVQE